MTAVNRPRSPYRSPYDRPESGRPSHWLRLLFSGVLILLMIAGLIGGCYDLFRPEGLLARMLDLLAWQALIVAAALALIIGGAVFTGKRWLEGRQQHSDYFLYLFAGLGAYYVARFFFF